MRFLDLCPFAFCLSAISEMGCVLFRSAFPRLKGPNLGRDPTAAEEQTFEADPGPGQHRAAFSQTEKINRIQSFKSFNLSQRYSKYTQFVQAFDPFRSLYILCTFLHIFTHLYI